MTTVRTGVRMTIDVEALLYIMVYVTSRIKTARMICSNIMEDLHSYCKVRSKK